MEHDGSVMDIRVIGGARRAAVEVRARHVTRGPRHYLLGWIVAGAAARPDGTLDFAIEPAVWRWELDGEQEWVPPSRAGAVPPFRPARGTYDARTGEVEPLVGSEADLATYDRGQLAQFLGVIAATLAQWRARPVDAPSVLLLP